MHLRPSDRDRVWWLQMSSYFANKGSLEVEQTWLFLNALMLLCSRLLNIYAIIVYIILRDLRGGG